MLTKRTHKKPQTIAYLYANRCLYVSVCALSYAHTCVRVRVQHRWCIANFHVCTAPFPAVRLLNHFAYKNCSFFFSFSFWLFFASFRCFSRFSSFEPHWRFISIFVDSYLASYSPTSYKHEIICALTHMLIPHMWTYPLYVCANDGTLRRSPSFADCYWKRVLCNKRYVALSHI